MQLKEFQEIRKIQRQIEAIISQKHVTSADCKRVDSLMADIRVIKGELDPWTKLMPCLFRAEGYWTHANGNDTFYVLAASVEEATKVLRKQRLGLESGSKGKARFIPTSIARLPGKLTLHKRYLKGVAF